MTKAHINPAMLQWAAERADVPTKELERAFRKSPEVVASWLNGSGAPTFKQAQALAKRLRVPFGYLFLDSPPDEALPLQDFRRVHGAGARKASIDLRNVIYDVLRKQDWYRDHRIDSDEEPLEFVGRFSLTSPVSKVAADIGASLDFDAKVRPESQRPNFLRAFVSQIEALGILVMRSGIVRQATNRPLKVEEFRGFSIADPMAPIIFVNNADSNAAQIFTLAHELAHIWIGRGGISDADLTIMADASEDIESFCNAVASELLLPWNPLHRKWQSWPTPIEQFVDDVSREFHVSTVMVARQLWAHKVIKRKDFFKLYETEQKKWSKNRESSSGGNYYLTAPIRNSRLLTKAILESVRDSETSIRDASRLLDIKPMNLSKLEQSMSTFQ